MGERKRRLALGESPSGRPARAPDLDGLLIQGRTLLAEGRVRDAFARSQQALALSPRHPEATHLMGQCCLAAGQKESALALLEAAVVAAPGNALYHASLGRALSQTGQLARAAEHLQAACALAADADIRRDLGAVLFHLDRHREAEDCYAEAVRLAPQRADLHEALARLRYRRDAMDEALASVGKAVELDPGLTRRLNIGHVRAGSAGMQADADALATTATADAVEPGPAITKLADGNSRQAALREACSARSLRVIDDFLDDPMPYRSHALELAYFDRTLQPGINYPGAQTEAQPCDAIMRRIADALGHAIKWDSLDNGAFRVSPASASARCDIHVDGERDHVFAAVLYLSLPEHCRGGTGFWRHRITGWERRPSQEELAACGYSSFREFERRWVPTDQVRPFAELREMRDAGWENVIRVPMRFNRLIAYRGDFFHAIGELFGDRPENSRLVQLFYFEGSGITNGAR
jgi:tetratricopeptide (TPR) repeat protein